MLLFHVITFYAETVDYFKHLMPFFCELWLEPLNFHHLNQNSGLLHNFLDFVCKHFIYSYCFAQFFSHFKNCVAVYLIYSKISNDVLYTWVYCSIGTHLPYGGWLMSKLHLIHLAWGYKIFSFSISSWLC